MSAAVSFAVHAGILAFLISVAIAPEEVVKLLPVKIVQELPGSNQPPPPKTIKARKAPARRQVARPRTAAAPKPVARRTQRRVDVAQVKRAQAPRNIQQRQIDSRRVVARRVARAGPARSIDIPVHDLPLDDLEAPTVDYTGPQEIPDANYTEADTPDAFQEIVEYDESQYTAVAEVDPAAAQLAIDDAAANMAVDVSGDFAIGDGSGVIGGTGTTRGVTECFSSAFVVRYLADVRTRTLARWDTPSDAKETDKVVLSFRLDVSGSVIDVKFKQAPSEALGSSAVAALRTAAPFNPMDDNNRCLSAHSVKATFTPGER